MNKKETNFHYNQRLLFNLFLDFQREFKGQGIEVIEDDLINAWRTARNKTSYFTDKT